jgi:hypothetical protein
VNTIDVKAASARGVYVANCPGPNAIAVAELTRGLILAVDRHIPDNVAALCEGKWKKKKLSEARGLYGRAIGIVGVGTIGASLHRRKRTSSATSAATSSNSRADCGSCCAGITPRVPLSRGGGWRAGEPALHRNELRVLLRRPRSGWQHASGRSCPVRSAFSSLCSAQYL